MSQDLSLPQRSANNCEFIKFSLSQLIDVNLGSSDRIYQQPLESFICSPNTQLRSVNKSTSFESLSSNAIKSEPFELEHNETQTVLKADSDMLHGKSNIKLEEIEIKEEVCDTGDHSYARIVKSEPSEDHCYAKSVGRVFFDPCIQEIKNDLFISSEDYEHKERNSEAHNLQETEVKLEIFKNEPVLCDTVSKTVENNQTNSGIDAVCSDAEEEIKKTEIIFLNEVTGEQEIRKVIDVDIEEPKSEDHKSEGTSDVTTPTQPNISQSEGLGEKCTWRIDLKTLLEETYLKERGFPISKDLPLKPPEPRPYVESYDDGDTSTSSDQSSSDEIQLPQRATDRSYTCSSCCYRTTQRIVMRNHLRIHLGQKPFKCNQCEYKASYKWNLDQHTRLHTGEKPYKCSECSYTATYKYSLLKHLVKHADLMPHKCNKCGYRTKDEELLTKHMKTHYGSFQCCTCGFKTFKSAVMQNHMIKHAREKCHKCMCCEFHETGNIASEVNTKGQVHCGVCDELVPRSSLLKHKQSHKIIKCCECGFIASSAWNLKLHTRNMHTWKSFRCATCDYTTNTKSALVLHVKSHIKENPYKCVKCNYSSTTSCDVNTHLKMHALEMPYKCTKCMYKTQSSSDLLQHLCSYPQQLLQKCTKCNYSADSQSDLEDHSKTHDKKIIFRCKKCRYTSEHRRELRDHVKNHLRHKKLQERLKNNTKDERRRIYRCRSCGYCSTSRVVVRGHLKTHLYETYNLESKVRNFLKPRKLRNNKKNVLCIKK